MNFDPTVCISSESNEDSHSHFENDPYQVTEVSSAVAPELSRSDDSGSSKRIPDRANMPLTPHESRPQQIQWLKKELIEQLTGLVGSTTLTIGGQTDLCDLDIDSISACHLANNLTKRWGISVPVESLFDQTTVENLAIWMWSRFPNPLTEHYQRHQTVSRQVESIPVQADGFTIPRAKLPASVTELGQPSESTTKRLAHDAIAIIGFQARFPGSRDMATFWHRLVNGISSISSFPSERQTSRSSQHRQVLEADERHQDQGVFLLDIDCFDHEFFQISSNEAPFLDPQERMFMETAWHTIEHAGYCPKSLAGTRTGAFVGMSRSDFHSQLKDGLAAGTVSDEARHRSGQFPQRLSRFLDLRGPCEQVNTRATSSLNAIHRAVVALRHGDCDQALAGGVHLILSPNSSLAPKTVGAEGVGAVLLKPLAQAIEEGDQIHGLIRTSVTGHSGCPGPSLSSQAEAQADWLNQVLDGIHRSPQDLGYLEIQSADMSKDSKFSEQLVKHCFGGSGSSQQRNGNSPSCWIGHHRHQLGEAEAASGILSLIKILTAMDKQQLPGNPELAQPHNENEDSPVRYLRTTQAWPASEQTNSMPRTALLHGADSDGNLATLVIEEGMSAPTAAGQMAPVATLEGSQRAELFLLSAAGKNQLKQYAQLLANTLQELPAINLRDLAATLATSRAQAPVRLAIIEDNLVSLCLKLRGFAAGQTIPKVFFGTSDGSPSGLKEVLGEEEGLNYLQCLLAAGKVKHLAGMWVHGLDFPWANLFTSGSFKRIPLPGYPFSRHRHWLELVHQPNPRDQGSPHHWAKIRTNTEPIAPPVPAKIIEEPAEVIDPLAICIRELVARFLKIEPQAIDLDADLRDYGFDSFSGTKIINGLEAQLDCQLSVTALFEMRSITELAGFLSDQGVKKPQQALVRESIAPIQTQCFEATDSLKALWFLHQQNPTSTEHHLPICLRVHGALNPDNLELALNELIKRHQPLRSRFVMRHSQLLVELRDNAHIRLERHKTVNQQKPLAALVADLANRSFDLESDLMFRVHWLEDRSEIYLLFVFHHLVFDGSSFALFLGELQQLLASATQGTTCSLDPLATNYAAFADWQTRFIQSEAGDQQRQYWIQQLADLPETTPLYSVTKSRSNSDQQGFQVDTFLLDPSIIVELNAVASEARTSLFAVMLTAFKVLLHRFTQQTDIVVGTPLAGRPRPEFEQLIGYFINMAAIRADLANNPSFLTLLGRVSTTLFQAIDHGSLPFADITNHLALGHGLDKRQVFTTGFVFQNWVSLMDSDMFANKTSTTTQVAGKTPQFELMDWVHETGSFDFMLEVLQLGSETKAYIKYNRAIYSAQQMKHFMGHYQHLLSAIAKAPTTRIGYLELSPPSSKQRPHSKPNELTSPQTPGLLTRFQETVAQQGSALALTSWAQTKNGLARYPDLTYAELAAKASGLASRLRSLGIDTDVPVAVFVSRSPDLIVAMLAVWLAGGCYVPIDPEYPSDRIRYMLADSQSPLILSSRDLVSSLPADTPDLLILEEALATKEPGASLASFSLPHPDQLAYIIYTSGSTGEPKGVLISHGALANYCGHFIDHYHLGPEDRVLQFASMSFDTAAEEIWPSLACGATLVLRDEEIGYDRLMKNLEAYQVTLLDLPTAYWHGLVGHLEQPGAGLAASVRLVIVGGEKACPNQYSFWEKQVGDRVVWSNTYGPTETTIVATHFEPVHG